MLPRRVKHNTKACAWYSKTIPLFFQARYPFRFTLSRKNFIQFFAALRRFERPAIALCEKPTLLRWACQLFFFTFQKNFFVASDGALSVLAHYLQLQHILATKQCQVEICAFQKTFLRAALH